MKWIIITFVIGLVVGVSITSLVLDNIYRKQIERINEEVGKILDTRIRDLPDMFNITNFTVGG